MLTLYKNNFIKIIEMMISGFKNDARQGTKREQRRLYSKALSDLLSLILQPYSRLSLPTTLPLTSYPPLHIIFLEFILNNQLPLLVYSCVARGKIASAIWRIS